jgi:hypothetical protein
MPHVIADVVGEGTDGKGQLVGRAGVAQERENEVAGADVMGEIGEEGVAEGVVAEVLDGAASVGVGVSLLELGFGESGEAFEQERANRRLPGKVDQLLVGLNGVRNAWRGCEK